MSRIFIHSLAAPMGFGKYASSSLKSVIDDDPSYIEWCVANIAGFAFEAEAAEYVRHAIPGLGHVTVADSEWRGHSVRTGGMCRHEDDDRDYDDDPYDIDYSCYNDQLDPDQQDKEFWDQF